MRSNSKTVGDLAELKVACLFAEKGYIVSRPMSDNAPYDLIVDSGDKLKRVQVKARCVRDGKINVELHTTMVNYTRPYSKEDFDLLAVFNTDTMQIALLDWDQIGDSGSIVLRIDAPKNNQNKNVKLFETYIPR